MNKDILILSGMALAAVALGTILYLYGANTLRGSGRPEIAAVIAHGSYAPISDRKNFRISNADDMQKLWALLYGNDASNTPPIPQIDFSRQEVVAVFAGEKPTGGYDIAVSGIQDSSNERMVSVTITAPGPSCMVAESQTSPFQVVTVPVSTLPFAHTDAVETNTCQ